MWPSPPRPWHSSVRESSVALPPETGACVMTLVPFRCRFETASVDVTAIGSQGEFCAFEFPGCEGCRYDLHAIKTAAFGSRPFGADGSQARPAPKNSFRTMREGRCG